MATPQSTRRRDDVFQLLKVIRRTLDAHQDVTGLAIQGATLARTAAAHVATVEAARAVCLQLIDERERLAHALDDIRRAIDLANLPPRTRNLGEGARGMDAQADG